MIAGRRLVFFGLGGGGGGAVIAVPLVAADLVFTDPVSGIVKAVQSMQSR